MKKLNYILPLLLAASFLFAEEPAAPGYDENLVILDEMAVKNLRIKTTVAEERDFETTVFAIGRIEEIPANHSSISSRISGRAIEVNAFEGDHVKKGQVLIKVESRQAGDPPPIVSLKALHSGMIISSNVHVGRPVEPNMEMLDISDRSVMWAIAKIPEQAAASVRIGTKARIHIPALGDALIEATVARYGVNADREAGTIEGIFEIPNPDGKLYPGMRAEFSIVISSRPDILAVPRTAVQGDPAKRVVYVKSSKVPNSFLKVSVHLGEQNDQYVEVINGVFEGDEIVTQGSYSLGFAGSSGISLKDALDAAHGHEHAEDGSELGEGESANESDDHGHDHGAEKASPSWFNMLLIYSGVVTLLLLILGGKMWNNRKTTT